MDYARTSAFIERYREKEILWNVNSPEYHNRTKRKEMVEELSRETCLSVDEVNKKVYNLRTYYQRELRKVQASRLDQSSEDVYVSKWPFFSALNFLQDIVTKRKSHSSSDVDSKTTWQAPLDLLTTFANTNSNMTTDDGATTSFAAFKTKDLGEEETICQASKSKKIKEENTSDATSYEINEQYNHLTSMDTAENSEEAFGRVVAHWLRCASSEIREDLKLGIHVICYHAIKHGSVPSFDLSTNSL